MFKFLALLSATLVFLPGLCAQLESESARPGIGHKTPHRTYKLTDSIVGKQFYEWFTWQEYGNNDPTHGRV